MTNSDTKDGLGDTVGDALRAIETAVLGELADVRAEERRVGEFRQRAESKKGSIDPAVWERVVNDYQSRLAALADRAEPLVERARIEYTKLQAVIDRVASERRTAEAHKAEVELRHAVGEVTDVALAEELKGAGSVLDRCARDRAAIDEVRARFVTAFGAEAALDAAFGTSENEDTNPAAPIEPGAEAAVAAKTKKLPRSAETLPPTGYSTVEAVKRSAGDPGGEGRSFMLPSAGFIVNPTEPAPVEIRLASVNFVGRSRDNHLQLARPGVSRRHAVVSAAGDAFAIKDLSSQNGVFVNGARILEHVLTDGDLVAIGDCTLLFRMPWPAPGARSRV
jgi:hypothetical protein